MTLDGFFKLMTMYTELTAQAIQDGDETGLEDAYINNLKMLRLWVAQYGTAE